MQASACNFFKKESLSQVFPCEFFKIFENTFFNRTPLVAAPVFVKEKFCRVLTPITSGNGTNETILFTLILPKNH